MQQTKYRVSSGPACTEHPASDMDPATVDPDAMAARECYPADDNTFFSWMLLPPLLLYVKNVLKHVNPA
jgi:hypothetical protein